MRGLLRASFRLGNVCARKVRVTAPGSCDGNGGSGDEGGVFCDAPYVLNVFEGDSTCWFLRRCGLNGAAAGVGAGGTYSGEALSKYRSIAVPMGDVSSCADACFLPVSGEVVVDGGEVGCGAVLNFGGFAALTERLRCWLCAETDKPSTVGCREISVWTWGRSALIGAMETGVNPLCRGSGE